MRKLKNKACCQSCKNEQSEQHPDCQAKILLEQLGKVREIKTQTEV